MLLCLLISHKGRRGEGKKAPRRGDFAAHNVNDHEAPASTPSTFCLLLYRYAEKGGGVYAKPRKSTVAILVCRRRASSRNLAFRFSCISVYELGCY